MSEGDLGNQAGKIGAEKRGRLLMINARKESHGPVEVADPYLCGTGIEVERAFFVDLGGGIRGGKDLDADLWRASEYEGSREQLGPATVQPHEVDGFDTVSGGKRAFGQSTTGGQEGLQQVGDLPLAVGVSETWRWTHDNVSMSIGFDPIGKPGELRISHELAPTSEVEADLRLQIWELNGDGHEVTKSMKAPRKQRLKSFVALAVGCFGGLALLWAFCQEGLRVNGTHSEPVGIYWAISKALSKGDFVFACRQMSQFSSSRKSVGIWLLVLLRPGPARSSSKWLQWVETG